MRGSRKICTNIDERTCALNYNGRLADAGELYMPRIKIPDPIFEINEFSFMMGNVLSYYIESQGERDIIVNILYEGQVRFAYDPALISVLENKFSYS